MDAFTALSVWRFRWVLYAMFSLGPGPEDWCRGQRGSWGWDLISCPNNITLNLIYHILNLSYFEEEFWRSPNCTWSELATPKIGSRHNDIWLSDADVSLNQFWKKFWKPDVTLQWRNMGVCTSSFTGHSTVYLMSNQTYNRDIIKALHYTVCIEASGNRFSPQRVSRAERVSTSWLHRVFSRIFEVTITMTS